MSYSQRLLQQGNSLTRLAHRSRFSVVLDAIGSTRYTKALDFGCGDGWLLRTAYDRGIITSGIGVDLAPNMIAEAQANFADAPGFLFCQPQEISEKVLPQSCDLIFCTETLEHVENPEKVIDLIIPYSQSDAKIVISVPIEIGPSLIAKQIGRYFANLKGGYGYERYRPSELLAAAFLWDASSFPSSHSTQTPHKAHKGFDYRKLEGLLKQKINIDRQMFSPFPWLGKYVNSTVIWIGSLKK